MRSQEVLSFWCRSAHDWVSGLSSPFSDTTHNHVQNASLRRSVASFGPFSIQCLGHAIRHGRFPLGLPKFNRASLGDPKAATTLELAIRSYYPAYPDSLTQLLGVFWPKMIDLFRIFLGTTPRGKALIERRTAGEKQVELGSSSQQHANLFPHFFIVQGCRIPPLNN